MSERPAIEAEGLVRTFGRVRALDGFDLQALSGEVLGLVGPNGAGKTTFIRMVAGLLPTSGGRLLVLGERPGGSVAGRIGYMTQSPALYEDLSVGENLDFFGRIYGLSSQETRERAAQLFDLLRLREKARAPVRTLSGGQRQLANLAVAMVHGPQLLLLDEPTVGIDPILRRTLWEHFARLNSEGTTILMTTHVMEEAEHCDRVALISSGRAIACGPPAELRARTRTASLEDAFLALRDAGPREQEAER